MKPQSSQLQNPGAPQFATMDGNEAAVRVAYQLSETIAMYPITPSSAMPEFADEWSAAGKPNIWGSVPELIEMQSEAGAAGAVHGMLQAGTLSTTFTASQGLLLMIPNLYKIAGELTPFCLHVTARTVATHALSIFGDHSDVMSCRGTGFSMLCSGSVQEAHDFAALAHMTTLRTRVPFMHFFDGFRTSHEISKIVPLSSQTLADLIDPNWITQFRQLALTPDRPKIRGTAQNPDVFFQGREATNPFYAQVPAALLKSMQKFEALTGRKYTLFDYVGAPDADRVIIMMGSGAETAHATVESLCKKGQKLGLLKVRLFRPFSVSHFLNALPKTVQSIAVLDRTKEPGSTGEPLYQDVITSLYPADGMRPKVIGGRYGLASKEFTPPMVKAIFDELAKPQPKNHFTIGIHDDVSHTSLDYDPQFKIEDDLDTTSCLFYGLGSDGTVGANKNSIKIIGEETEHSAQGFFVYDSKKSGAMTVSHLRFGQKPIRTSYLISQASFIACHHYDFLDKVPILENAAPGATFLLNTRLSKDEVWDDLSQTQQQLIINKNLKFYVINASEVAKKTGMGGRVNTIMQTCFFALSQVLPREQAIEQIKKAIHKTYSKKGMAVVEKNHQAVDQTLASLYKVEYPQKITSQKTKGSTVPDHAPQFVKDVTSKILEGRGDELPVSALPVDGTWPIGTTQYEKRNVGLEIPVWDPSVCIQCNKCSFVCPHAAIRPTIQDPQNLKEAPSHFKFVPFKSQEIQGKMYSLQVAPEDCTGCGICIEVCPAKNKASPKLKAINLAPQAPIRDTERKNLEFFMSLPPVDRDVFKPDPKNSQFMEPLMEFSGACSGCGETPYIKLLTQLFGDRLMIANATGCSSIYGGNLPTTPYTVNHEGRGPAWANSLFEDNAEFGLGMRLSLDHQTHQAKRLLAQLSPELSDIELGLFLGQNQILEKDIKQARALVQKIKSKLQTLKSPNALQLLGVIDSLVPKSVWIVGGDGWAYDIGYGGLDHVLASGKKVNILVLDTEVYSNTGGQASKSTPLAASAKFASGGKPTAKKDLGLMAMSYSNVYVARVAFGAKDLQTVQAFMEAESFEGPSIIIAYSHCIAHGYSMHLGLEQQKLAVDSGHWPLFRYDPRKKVLGEPPLKLDSSAPKIALGKYIDNEIRYRILENLHPAEAKALQNQAQAQINEKYAYYEYLSKLAQKPGEKT